MAIIRHYSRANEIRTYWNTESGLLHFHWCVARSHLNVIYFFIGASKVLMSLVMAIMSIELMLYVYVRKFLKEIWIIVILIFCFSTFQPQTVLNSFLFSHQFQPSPSYKVFSYYKKGTVNIFLRIYNGWWILLVVLHGY